MTAKPCQRKGCRREALAGYRFCSEVCRRAMLREMQEAGYLAGEQDARDVVCDAAERAKAKKGHTEFRRC